MATIFKLLRAKARVAFELSRLTFSGVGYLLHPTYGNEKKKKHVLQQQQSCLHNVLSERFVDTYSFSRY